MSTTANALNLSTTNPLSELLGGTGMSASLPIDTLIQQNTFNFAVTGGSADAYTVTLNPVPAAYTDGMIITVLANRANTTSTPTLKANALGAISIVTSFGALQVGDMTLDSVYQLVYSLPNNNFTLLNPTFTFASSGLVQANFYNSATDTGTANAYIAFVPPFSNLPEIGAFFWVLITHNNTTASTLNLNSSGAKDIINLEGSSLVEGELIAGTWAQFVWDGTNYQLQNSALTYLTSAIVTIDGDTGHATGTTVAVYTNGLCGSSVGFTGNNTALQLAVTDISGNTIIGLDAGNSFPNIGGGNTALGTQALFSCIDTTSNNTAIGYNALYLVTGVNNTALGENSLSNVTTGVYNLGLGQNSGDNYTAAESSNVLLNSQGVAAESHVLRIGAATGTGTQQLQKAYISGINGNTVSNQLFVTINSATDQLGVVSAAGLGAVLLAPSAIQNITGYALTLNNLFVLYPSAPTSGALVLGATVNATGNFATTVTNAAAVAQNQTITIPDVGASTGNFILSGLASAATQHITSGSLQIDAGNLSLAGGGRCITYPATPSSGQFQISPTANGSGNFNTVVTNANAVGQTQTISVPDCGAIGASFILTSSASGTQNIAGALTLSSVAVATTVNNTFTPGVTFGGGSTGITYTNQVGVHTIAGNVCNFSIYIQLSNVGSSTGVFAITNLPIASRAAGLISYLLNIQISGGIAIPPGVTGTLLQNTSQVTASSQGLTSLVYLNNTSFANTTEIFLSGSYLV